MVGSVQPPHELSAAENQRVWGASVVGGKDPAQGSQRVMDAGLDGPYRHTEAPGDLVEWTSFKDRLYQYRSMRRREPVQGIGDHRPLNRAVGLVLDREDGEHLGAYLPWSGGSAAPVVYGDSA